MDSKNLTQKESQEIQTEWHLTLRQYKCKVNRAVEEEDLNKLWEEFINNKNLGDACILTQKQTQEIFDIYQNEWYKTLEEYVDEVGGAIEDDELAELWKEFINNKNLGVICILAEENSKDDKYIVTDEKAWMISKIKYGI